MVESPEFICAGHKWKLQLYPGGDADEDRNEDWMSLHLFCVLPSKSSVVKADVAFSIIAPTGTQCIYPDFNHDYEEITWDFHDFTECLICNEFAKRSTVLKRKHGILNEGTLTIQVYIRLDTDMYSYDDKEQTSLSENLLQLFLDENTEDVAFKVEGKILKAHQTILRAHVPDLAELCRREHFRLTAPPRNPRRSSPLTWARATYAAHRGWLSLGVHCTFTRTLGGVGTCGWPGRFNTKKKQIVYQRFGLACMVQRDPPFR